ncbi:sugar-binding protein [Granulosicoccaceae sp. 1_MG-2023]|nr:sugar-binding protein [Granulosicoccaceae sp. 1_MG-2023]
MTHNRPMYRISVWLFLLLTLSLSACGGGGSSSSSSSSGSVIADDSPTSARLRVVVPEAIATADNVIQSQLYVSVTLNGTALGDFAAEAGDTSVFSRDGVSLQGDAVNTFVIVWYEKYDGRELALGKVSASQFVAMGETPVTVDGGSFNKAYDADNDGFYNLDERTGGTDPFVSPDSTAGGNPSLIIKAWIPSGPYTATPTLKWKWGGKGGEIEQPSNTGAGPYFQVNIPNRSVGDSGGIELRLMVGGQQVADTVTGSKKLTHSGGNVAEFTANDFKLKEIKLSVAASLPDRDYRDPVRVRALIGDSEGGELELDSGNRYSTTLGKQSTGKKQLTLEIRRANDDLLWASAQKEVYVKVGPNSLSFAEADFDFSYDEDGDGMANINDPSPLVAGEPEPDLVIEAVESVSYDPVESEGRAPSGISTPNRIENVMIGADVYEEVFDSFDLWGAVHDGEYLYVRVSSADTQPWSDSGDDIWHDDAIEIYWDGNNSKGNTYDGVDDARIIIPAEDRSSGQARAMMGANSFTTEVPDGFWWFSKCSKDSDFGTWTCDYWVTIPLKAAGITVGKPFGFDVHIHDDDDGGKRDSKRGWYHPASSGKDIDYTPVNPSYMGTLVLE